MNFFEAQDKARRQTWLLIFYFLLAAFAVVLAVDFVVYAVMFSAQPHHGTLTEHPGLFISISCVVFGAILLATLVQYWQLRRGADAVAKMLGAQIIPPDSDDYNQQRFINVVHEMAIASGLPVPNLYVMPDEPGINAFVSGVSPMNTIMVVTQGALENFDREELQAVVGHEFSHIFNGDMSINIRLIALVSGIMIITRIGMHMLSGSRSNRRSNGNAQLALALLVIGGLGYLAGIIIKAAVSRQRELLADSCSAQYTRNPMGLAAALLRIEQHSSQAKLQHKRALDVSHMCFAPALRTLFATHPPIEFRVKQLANEAQAREYFVAKLAKEAQQKLDPEPPKANKLENPFAIGALLATTMAIEAAGSISQQQITKAEHLLPAIPEKYRLHALDRNNTISFLVALLVARKEYIDTEKLLTKFSTELDIAKIKFYLDELTQVPLALQLSLLLLTAPQLRFIKPEAKPVTKKLLADIVHADQKVDFIEYFLLGVFDKLLREDPLLRTNISSKKCSSMLTEIGILFANVAHHSNTSSANRERYYQQHLQAFGAEVPDFIVGPRDALSKLEASIHALDQLSFNEKSKLLQHLIALLKEDGFTEAERQMFYLIALFFDCPMPADLVVKA